MQKERVIAGMFMVIIMRKLATAIGALLAFDMIADYLTADIDKVKQCANSYTVTRLGRATFPS